MPTTDAASSPTSGREILARLAPAVLVAPAAWLLGARAVAIVALVSSGCLLLVGWLAPARARAVDRSVARFAERVGHVVSQALLSLVWALLVLPVGAIGALLRRVRRRPVLAAAGWHPVSTDARHHPQRTFSPPMVGAVVGSPLSRLLTLLLAVLVGALAAVQLWPERTVERAAVPPVVFRPQVYESEALAETVAYAFADEPWAEQALIDAGKTSAVPDAVRGWRMQDVRTRYVNVIDGQRVSYAVEDPTVTVWFFGGSTTFGDGQRDEHTIPSEIVRLAEAAGVSIRAVNFGVGSYNNLQGTLAFVDALAVEPAPDIAVFYDGSNESATARERVLYGELDPERPYFQAPSDEERAERAARAPAVTTDPEEQRELVIELGSAQYRRGADLARWAGAANGVEVVHVWQPGLWSTPVRPFTQPLLDAWGVDESMLIQEAATMAEMRERSGVDPIDLSGALADVDRPTFFDFEHTNELGARTIAARLFEELWPRLAEA